MKIKLTTPRPQRRPTDIAAFALRTDWQKQIAAVDRSLRRRLIPEAKRQGFSGRAGEIALFQTHGSGPGHYVLLAGLSQKNGTDNWCAMAHAVGGRAADLKATSATITLPESDHPARAVEQAGTTLLLGAYRFTRYKTGKRSTAGLGSVTLVAKTVSPEMHTALETAGITAQATAYARDLTNAPAALVTPLYLATEAKRLADEVGLEVRVLDRAEMRKLGMGAILGVAQGSSEPPAFIELIHRPRTAPGKVVAIAGKGITFDSGGLSLKLAGGMETMKRDMAGGGVVLAVMSAVGALAPGIEVRGYVAASENMPDGQAFKPGDVLTAHNGKTIEVLNTDAEGRLVLADALSYAAAAKPQVLIDLATLTGAVRSALGTRYAAVMGTDRDLVQQLIAAGEQCGDYLWELPLVDEYRPDIDSEVADIKNVGDGAAGTIIGGLFLREFVGGLPWAHIDFSSTVMVGKPQPGRPRGASGFGVRLLLQYLRDLDAGSVGRG